MTLNMHARLTADGKQAQAELAKTGQGARELKTDVDAVGRSGRETSADFQALQKRMQAYKVDLVNLRAEHAAAKKQIDGLRGELNKLKARTNETKAPFDSAAGSVGNLTSQFNDIGVMLAAGQNPLQLAIQQGTQIGQVFQQTGAKGKDAFKLLLQGATSMLSPINLITIGTIAMGGALVNWLSRSSKEAENVEDVLERLSGSVDALRQSASLSASEIVEEFGSINPELARMLAQIRDRGLSAVEADARAAAQALIRESGGLALEISRIVRRSGDAEGRRSIQEALGDLYNATTVDDQVRAVENLKRVVDDVSAGVADARDKQKEFRDAVLDTEQELRRGQQAGNAVVDVLRDGWSGAVERVEEYTRLRIEAWQSGQAMLATLQEENHLRATALTFGEDSIQFAEARAAAERRAFDEVLAGLDVSTALKDEMRLSFEHGQAFSRIELAGGIGSAADEATRLASELGRALNAAISLSAQGVADMRTAEINWEFRDDPVGRAGALAGERFDADVGAAADLDPLAQDFLAQQREEYVANAEAVEELRQKTIAWRKEQAEAGRAAGGAAKASRKARSAVRDLIAAKQEELDLLRESDPIQQEMIRLREDLTGATEGEIRAVAGLITTIQAEELAKAQAAETSEFFRTSMSDLIPDLVRGGDDAASAWQRFGRALEDAAWQALLLGEGPLMGLVNTLFGISGGGGGGLLGWIGGLFGFAEGGSHEAAGMHYGLGGPKSDRIPILTSAGEFTVNAKATQKHRPLLEAINAGAPIPGFAEGGAHGGGSYSPAPVEVQFELIDQTERGLKIVRQERGDGRQPAFVASDMVDEAMNLPGGKARRSLRRKGLRDPMVRT
ncbi:MULTISPECIES: phage tail length tape measure family protein [unclassified Mameliella]|uniref:phage tail length tape measure family protein n=1 Tax=unclassified Mameliella TaxID=2630630 RepID=UPI00273D75C2|nr:MULTISPECIES: phage tail length tape measure family protein [unclassified Mameliella]